MSFFSDFFGDSDLENIDARIDNLINNLPESTKSIPVDNISGDFINEFIQQESSSSSEIQRLLDSVSVSRERLERYNVYDEAYKYVPIIKRMVAVYIANILQKNPVTGKCIIVREAEDLTGNKKTNTDVIVKAKKLAEECIKSFDLTLKLRKKILPNQLVYGDCYCEIVDINAESKKKVDPNVSFSNIMSAMPLFESELKNMEHNLTQMKIKKEINGAKPKVDQIEKILEKISEYLVEIEEFPGGLADNQKSNLNDADDTFKYDNILIKIHKPHRVIVLETDFGSLLGYLIITKDEVPQTINLTQSLSTLVGRITTLQGLDQKSQDTIVDRLVRYMLKTVLSKSQKAGKIEKSTNIDQLLSSLPADVQKYMKRLFIEQGLAQKGTFYNRLRIRFVPSSNMLAFTTPSAEFDPYGQSFIDALVFPCKLYILSQLSNVIIKLSRAAPVRKWTLDVGQAQMQAGQIQKLKRELYNTRITLDDLSSFKSIPKILSDYQLVTF